MRIGFAASLVVLITLASASSAWAGQRSEREKLRDQLRDLLSDRQRIAGQFDAAVAQRDAAVENAKAAQAKYDETTEQMKALTQSLAETRRQAADTARSTAALEQELREKVEAKPEIAEARERFRRIDAARLAIHDSIATRVRTDDDYRALEQKLTQLREKRELTGGASADELALMLAQEQTIELEMKQLLENALAASDQYKTAKVAADEADRAYGLLRDREAAAIREHPGVATMRQTADTLRRTIAEQDAQLDAARRVQTNARTVGRRANAEYAAHNREATMLERRLTFIDQDIRRVRDLLGE